MNAIKPLAETRDSVTLTRADYQALLEAADIADDVRLIDERRAAEREQGIVRARRDYLSVPEMETLLDGANRLRFWREKRGLPQGALATAIGVPKSYLAEVETDKKPGSTDLFRRVAGFLDLPLERLLPIETAHGAAAMKQTEQAAERLERKAGNGATRDQMIAEAQTIVAEWRTNTDAPHQVKAMVSRLRSLLGHSPVLEAARDALGREARKLK